MEKYELVDGNGNKTGNILIFDEFNTFPDGNFLPVVGVIIVNEKNEILLQKRSKLKRVNPHKWGICGGKVEVGETILDAAIRETFEEIGILLDKEELKFLCTATIGKVHFSTYYVRKNVDESKCKLQYEEVESLRYFAINEIENLETEGIEWLADIKRIIF